MISYKALTRASITLQKIDEIAIYECEVFSSNGNILQPYDLKTTLTGVVYKDFKDITKEFDIIKWKMFNENSDNQSFVDEWNKKNINKNPITITDKEINGKVIIQFEAYKIDSGGQEVLRACKSITLIDINDIIAITEKPTNPYEGQLWVDSSTNPATLWLYQNGKWNMVGTVSATVKNLIKNSNFITLNYKPFEILGDVKNQYYPNVKVVGGRKWLNIKSDSASEEYKGVYQTTDDDEKINKNSKYSFQLLGYATSESNALNNSIEIRIFSINKSNIETLLYNGGLENQITLNKNVCRFFTVFSTLVDTEKLRVEIIGKPKSRYDFNITQLALYNTDNDYPWQSHPEDTDILSNKLTPEEIFNLLTYDGKIQGIFSAIDPETGQLQYYFNATYIKSGTIKGDLIDAKNLTVTKDDGTKTLHIDDKGNVFLTVSSLVIGSANQSLEDYINSKLEELDGGASMVEVLDSMLLQVQKDFTVTDYVYNEINNHPDFQKLIFDGDVNDWLSKDEQPSTPITLTKDLLLHVYQVYLKAMNDLVDIIKKCKENYENNKVLLNNLYTIYNTKFGIINKLFVSCQAFISDAQIKVLDDQWAQMQIDFRGITTEVGRLQETVTIQNGAITDVRNELNSVKQEITPESLTTKVKHIVTTNGEIEKHIESISSQTAQGFTQAVEDKLTGNISEVKQTVEGLSERITSIGDKKNYSLEMYAPDGTVLKSATNSTVAYAKVFDWGKEITSTIPENRFNWYRRSKDKASDDYWNSEYGKGRKSITITTNDILSYATFHFTVDI